MASGSNEPTLEMTRVVPAARSAVFSAFVDPAELVKWFGPKSYVARSLEFDARVGRSFRIEVQPPVGDPFYLGGEFREIEPPVRLAYTFIYEDPDPDDLETLVSVSLGDLGTSTEVALTQGPFKTEARRALHERGWTDSFDKLVRLISVQA
jgi:uncharacterized protein YndB with AHSA1/START domain